jgi:hypothetical protein
MVVLPQPLSPTCPAFALPQHKIDAIDGFHGAYRAAEQATRDWEMLGNSRAFRINTPLRDGRSCSWVPTWFSAWRE